MKALVFVILAALLTATPQVSQAQARYVVVNGQRMGPAQLQRLDRASCSRVPNGRYWLNLRSGVWGYEGGPPQGRMGENCPGSDARACPSAACSTAPGVAALNRDIGSNNRLPDTSARKRHEPMPHARFSPTNATTMDFARTAPGRPQPPATSLAAEARVFNTAIAGALCR